MMTPKDPKSNPHEGAKNGSKPEPKAKVKKTVAKEMGPHHGAANKAVKPRSPKATPADVPQPDAPQPNPAPPQTPPSSLLVGDYAHGLVQQHFQRMLRDRADVVDDRDPAALHQMRVQGRRLQATIELFGVALKIPKQGQLKPLQRFHRTLGQLRNLDVVTARLQQDYYPNLPEPEQQVLDRCFKKLTKQRRRALEDVQVAIAEQTFEAVYTDWLAHPAYHDFAQRSLTAVLPELLLPDFAAFLAHPGWAIAAADMGGATPVALHDLRKVGKHRRYQLEAVTPIYGAEVADWVVGLKAIQDCLGTLQDLVVLQKTVQAAIALPDFMALLQQQQQAALAQWEELRQPYLQPQFHYQCYESILQVLKA